MSNTVWFSFSSKNLTLLLFYRMEIQNIITALSWDLERLQVETHL